MRENSKNQLGHLKVFKFGGASVRDAESVQNMVNIIAAHKNEKLLVVVSAMGKMTNAFEALLNQVIEEEPAEIPIEEVKNFHDNIIKDLGLVSSQTLREDMEEIS